MKVALALLVAVCVACCAGAFLGGHAQAQQAAQQPAQASGVVSGTIRNGTAGAATPTLRVQLLAVPRNGSITAIEQMATGGRFRFEVTPDPNVTYLLRTEYQGVPYLDNTPLLLAPGLPGATRELVVWEATHDRPALRITSTVVSALSLSRQDAVLTLRREDTVENPTDRVYVGDGQSITLRIPGPDGITAVEPQSAYDAVTGLEGQIITSTQPLRPGKNTVVTTMAVGYDPAAPAYRLRTTAPLPTQLLEVAMPARFLDDLTPTSDDATTAAREEGGERWLIVRSKGAAVEGQALVVSLDGLSGLHPVNPLTTGRGAAVATVVALGSLVAAFGVLMRLRPASVAAS